ncbi:MAG: hypothetical protein ACREM1_17915 [Longimicrobiales bacterium]
MASLLAELLHDTSRRGEEIAEELRRLQGQLPGEVEAYRERMLVIVERARGIVALMLADPDMEDPAYATRYFRDYKHVARLMHALENLPLLVLRRFNEQDRTVTSLMAAMCREIGFPHAAPICSSISSQYYWTVPDMDLVFVPCLEPDHLLGLPDGYHELGHILLFRDMKRLVHPALAIVDGWYDKALARGQELDWPRASLDEVDGFRHQWRRSWLLEFGADLIATYLVGPAFGWCNIRTSTNMGGGIFGGSESHPADDARASAVGLMLQRIGCGEACDAIRRRWNELVALANESRPNRYDLAYPGDLLAELVVFFQGVCNDLGLRQYAQNANELMPVTMGVNQAWDKFRENPNAFSKFEPSMLAALVAQL